MKAVLAMLALMLAAASPASAPTGSIDPFIAGEMPRAGAPGLAYAIVGNGAIRSEARGEVLAGSGVAVTPDTPFLLGSLSKSFTALAVMQLVEAGKVELDSAIARYLKAFAGQPGAAITVRQLLSHTSGFSTLQGNQTHQDPGPNPNALARQVDRVARWAPAYPPGTRWEYSNANYQILGALIETVSGLDYARYVETRILQPIGMRHSFVADGARHDEMARGHRPWFGAKRALPAGRTDRITAPQGGVIASATDVARYLAVMMNGMDDVVSARAKAEMLRPASAVSPFYGLGWFLDAAQGTAFHTGSSPGIETLAVLVPARKAGVVVLVNAGSGIGFGETAPLREGIAARALGLPLPEADGRWQQKALFAGLAALPLLFLLSMVWAWRHRAALRAKSGAFGQFSLWFPLLMMLAMAWMFFGLIPLLFGVSIGTLKLFQPDLVLIFAASSVTGILWAGLRLVLARGGKARPVDAAPPRD